MTPDQRPSKTGDTTALWRAAGLGVELIGAVLGMGLIGWLIDRWQGWSPVATIIGFTVGALGGGYNFFRAAQRLNRESQKEFGRGRHAGTSRGRDSNGA